LSSSLKKVETAFPCLRSTHTPLMLSVLVVELESAAGSSFIRQSMSLACAVWWLPTSQAIVTLCRSLPCNDRRLLSAYSSHCLVVCLHSAVSASRVLIVVTRTLSNTLDPSRGKIASKQHETTSDVSDENLRLTRLLLPPGGQKLT